ncbi:MAG: penicillin-binding protein 2 [SAR324 cluster bacterium]|nr:penicillin-binding protein 2 [SAR324 cluster bacterium]
MNKIRQFNVYNFHSRIFSVMCLIGLCLLLVLGRVFYLQIWNAEYFNELAQRQQQRTIKLESKRSPIYDRQQRLLAISVKVDSVHALPQHVQEPEKTARILSPLLQMEESVLLEKLTSQRSFVWIKRQISPALSAQIKNANLKGIAFIREYRRYYPLGNFAGPLLGFTGVDSQGLEGLEYEYQELLQGKKYNHVVAQDGTHRTVPSADYNHSKDSNHYTLHLTIDSSIQYFAEKALKKGLARMDAKKGIAIVMETQTGAVLAMANVPGFNPNNYQKYPRSHYLNYAVSSGYEPGSTLKLVTLATALEENILQEDQAFFCENGSYQIADQVIHDVKPHGWLTVEQIIQKSSNICASKIGLAIEKETFFDYLQQFGFGNKVNIGLSAEAVGKVPAPKDWTEVDHASIAFGHGILSSPIQLLTAVNSLGTGGMLVYPYVIESVENKQGRKVKEIQNVAGKVIYRFGMRESKRVLSEKTANRIKQFMISVTHKGGSGSLAAIPGVEVAGKTGTTEIFDEVTQAYSKKEHIASFIGLVPAANPVLTILIVIESPKKSHYGGTVAAPVFREIAERSLIFMGKGMISRKSKAQTN